MVFVHRDYSMKGLLGKHASLSFDSDSDSTLSFSRCVILHHRTRHAGVWCAVPRRPGPLCHVASRPVTNRRPYVTSPTPQASMAASVFVRHEPLHPQTIIPPTSLECTACQARQVNNSWYHDHKEHVAGKIQTT